jgi:hypothetical protein
MPDSYADIPFRNIKRVRQLTGSYCGAASLQILLSHFGLEVHQEQIIDAAMCRDTVASRGMSVEQIARAAKVIVPGMNFWVKRESNLSDLVKMLREFNYPVAVDWQGVFEFGDEYDDGGSGQINPQVPQESDGTIGDQGHYSVVVDVDTANNYIRISDPYGSYAGKDRLFMIQEFLSRWWDDRMDIDSSGKKNYVYENRLTFLVLPKSLSFPEDMGMKKID